MAPKQPTEIRRQSNEINPFRRPPDQQNPCCRRVARSGIRIPIPKHASQRRTPNLKLAAVKLCQQTLGAGAREEGDLGGAGRVPVLRLVDVGAEDAATVPDGGGELGVGEGGGEAFEPEAGVEVRGDVGVADGGVAVGGTRAAAAALVTWLVLEVLVVLLRLRILTFRVWGLLILLLLLLLLLWVEAPRHWIKLRWDD